MPKKYTLNELKQSKHTFMKFIIQEHQNGNCINDYNNALEFYFNNSKHITISPNSKKLKRQFNYSLKTFAESTG